MMEQKPKMPTLRFPEFSNEWKRKRISEITNVTAGATPSTFNSKYWNGNIRWMNSGELNLKRVYEVENRITEKGLKNSSTKIIPKYCILIGLAGQGKTRGTVAMNMIELCTNQSIAAILPNSKIYSPDFLYHNLDNRYEELRGLSTGDGGRGGLNLQIIKSLILYLPTLPEQEIIAAFLTAVDDKLQVLKKKKALLEKYKKGLMQKIFSQEIRFKDENGNDFPDWEEKKLGECLIKNSKKNNDKKVKLVQSVSNKLGFVNQEDYFEDRVIASKDLSNYYIIEKGVFAYNPSRINVGSLAYKQDEKISVVSPLYISFKADNSFLIDQFLLNWFESEKFIKQMNASFEGSVRNTLSYQALIKINIKLPFIEEQNKITNFIIQIDRKISHYQILIDKAEQWKMGLLQKMFC